METHRKPKSSTKRSKPMRALRAVTKAPRLLASHVKNVLRDELYIDVKYRSAPKEVNKELASFELLAAYHLWLRGVVAFMAVIVFLLSLMAIDGSETIVNWTIFLVSVATTLVIVKVYEVKAQYTGITNVIYKDTRNIFISPHFFQMVLELAVWNIQTPPIVLFWHEFFNMLNYFLFIRLYAVIVYLNHAAYVHRTFCRAMAALSSNALSTSFLIRSALNHRKLKTSSIFVAGGWISLSLMYSKAEWCSIGDGFWFTFQAIGTIGYGDLTPLTASGRFVVFLCYLFSLILAGYAVALFQRLVSLANNEHNLHNLIRCNKLARQVRYDAARVIQRTWRLHVARGQKPTKVQQAKVLIQSWILTHYIALMSRHRQQFSEAQRQFKESSVNAVTGLSGYQQSEYMQHIQLTAQAAQKVKDAIAISRALAHRAQVEAGSGELAPALTRDDIFRILGVGHMASSDAAHSPTWSGVADVDPEESARIAARIEGIERKAGQLAKLLETLEQQQCVDVQ